MKVEGPKSTSSVRGPGAARKAGPAAKAGEFAAELDKVSGADEAAGAEGPSEVSGIANVGGILAAQSVAAEGAPDHQERKRRAQRGVELLDRLEDLRRGLLLGTIPKDKLGELARMVREKRERGADAVISRLLDEIELRAEVEIAKLSRRI
ncbi:MAG: flagellar assembly protein FliX [Rhodospirillaceae bacterium]